MGRHLKVLIDSLEDIYNTSSKYFNKENESIQTSLKKEFEH